MPIDPLIYATTATDLPADEVNLLTDDLVDALDINRFHDHRRPVSRVPLIDYEHGLPRNLPRTRSIIEVSAVTPYYGKTYARGSWPELALILEFLRYRVPSCEVWYGDDSSE
jgi:hypothetical protein